MRVCSSTLFILLVSVVSSVSRNVFHRLLFLQVLGWRVQKAIRGELSDAADHPTVLPSGTIEDSETLPTTALKGFVDPNTLPKVPQGQSPAPPGDKAKKEIPLAAIVGIPDLEVSFVFATIVLLPQFVCKAYAAAREPSPQAAAEAVLSTKSFAYYSAGATNMHTLALNTSAWDQVLFKPRVLVDVAEVDTRTKFLGYDTTLPIFIAPSGMAKLSHPRGETAMAEAAGHEGIIQFVSTNASAKLEDIIGAATSKEQPFMMQL